MRPANPHPKHVCPAYGAATTSFALFLLVISVGGVQGQTKTNNYTGANDGFWTTGANWSLGVAPSTNLAVVISNGVEVRNPGTEGGFFTITAIPEPTTYLAVVGLMLLLLGSSARSAAQPHKSSSARSLGVSSALRGMLTKQKVTLLHRQKAHKTVTKPPTTHPSLCNT